jgi:L-threonylcarbamoyladenylate synthase
MYKTVQEAVAILLNGGIVAFPTETVYGLGACATDQAAIQKIYLAKNRPSDNPLICHFFSIAQVKEYVAELPQVAELLLTHFSPGPLSVLLNLPPHSPLLPATGGRRTVMCRIPAHPIALELLREVKIPLAAPSANTSGKMSGTTAEMVEHDLGNKIDGVIDGGPTTIGLESTIIEATDNTYLTILRPGSIGAKELDEFLTTCYEDKKISSRVTITVGTREETTPGAKYHHYAPSTPLHAVSDIRHIILKPKSAILATEETLTAIKSQAQKNSEADTKEIFYLSLGTDPESVARNLYKNFYELDKLKVTEAYIVIPPWGDSSIEQALKNRVSKVLRQG